MFLVLVGAIGIGQRLWQNLIILDMMVSLNYIILILLIFIVYMISYYLEVENIKINVTYNDFI